MKKAAVIKGTEQIVSPFFMLESEVWRWVCKTFGDENMNDYEILVLTFEEIEEWERMGKI